MAQERDTTVTETEETTTTTEVEVTDVVAEGANEAPDIDEGGEG